MIGIIGAMDMETEGLISGMEKPERETVSGVTYTRGKLEGKDVVVATCGIGKVNAAICAQTMILRYHPALIINTGVAGTLTPELGIGDVAVGARLVQHDMDTGLTGDPYGYISGVNRVYFEADKETSEKLAACVNACGARTVRGTIATGDQFIASAERKALIVERFGAIACEMEGGAIAHVATANGTPFAVLRAISDNADGGATEDFSTFARKAAERSIAVMRRFLKG